MGIDSAVGCIALISISLGAIRAETPAADYLTLSNEGRIALEAGRFEPAATALDRALKQMQSAGQTPETTLPVVIALSTAWLNLENVSRAERALLDGDKLAAAATSSVLKAALKNNWAILHLRIGHYTQAHTEITEGLSLIGNLPEAQLLEARLLNTLTVVETRLGQYTAAISHQQQALSLWTALRPPHHPDLIQAHSALGVAQYFAGSAESAHLSFQAAIASARQTYGAKSPVLADLLENDAVVLSHLGLKSEARAQQRAASHASAASSPSVAALTRAATALAPPGQ